MKLACNQKLSNGFLSLTTASVMGALLLLLLSTSAQSKSLVGVSMPATKVIGGKTLKLNGLGLREATIFKVDVYVAGLYVEETSTSATKLLNAEGPKHLLMKFVRNVDADDLSGAWKKALKKGGGPVIAKKVARLNAMMKAVKKGETLAITYIPIKGTIIHVNGKKRGTIKGKGFSRWLFAVWLGKNPPNAGLKRGLLGK